MYRRNGGQKKMKRWKNDFILAESLKQSERERQENNRETPCPPEIVEWVAQLKLLKGMPLSCLIGDEKQLPPESIRFFYLDENWTEQMVNGALSIGADNEKAKVITAFFQKNFQELGRKNRYYPRRKRIHENQLRFYRKEREAPQNNVITGFLLRSRLVRLWKGLESTACDHEGTRLEILRMEQLSEEILLCMYDGEIDKLCIREPKEGLRFGTHENDRILRVRGIKSGEEGVPVPGQTIKMQANEFGRADILGFAERLRSCLKSDCLTSAEFAMELITAPGLGEFSLKTPDEKLRESTASIRRQN